MRFLLDFLDTSLDRLAADERDTEKRRWAGRVNALTVRPGVSQGIPREVVRGRLTIPSPYFIGRGVASTTLDAFCVGEPHTPRPDSPLAGRAICPVFDHAGRVCVGYAARSTDGRLPKWVNHGFPSGQHLYGWWEALPHVKRTRSVVLVEGPLDCLKLHSAGVHAAVALFGVGLHDGQLIALEMAGVTDVVLLLDWDRGDGAGRQATERIRSRLKRAYRVHVPDWVPPSGDDVGAESVGQLKTDLLPSLGRFL